MIPITTPRLLPPLDQPHQDETRAAYGLRVLQFVIAQECTATLDTESLELADHFYPLAVCAPELSPAVVDRLADARRMIQSALRWREADAQAAQDAMSQGSPTPLSDRPNQGPMAKLIPPTPPLPPAPEYVPIRQKAEINF